MNTFDPFRFRKARTTCALLAGLLVAGFSAAFAAPAGPADFSLTEAGGGKTFKLSEQKGKYVALHFLLKTDCPNCLEYVHKYSALPAMPNVVHVFIKPDDDDVIKAWEAKLTIDPGVTTPTIYRDPDGKLADDFGIAKTYQFHGETVHFPALIILGPDGKEVFRFVGDGTRDRYPVETFATKISELRHAPAVALYNLDKSKLAVQGYDVVTYLDPQGPKAGSKEFSTEFAGATYYFVSAANRDKFLANPDKYLPAYGGWCASAMAFGKKVEIDPENFKVTNGRVFLFYKSFIQNALNDWNKHESEWLVDADKHWKEIAGES